MSLPALTACLGLLLAPGCAMQAASTRPAQAVPRTVAVVCSAGGTDVDCFRRASETCGAAGYDLYDRDGRQATVADAAFHILEARCRK